MLRFGALLWLGVLLSGADAGYREEIERWRAHHEAELKQDEGWLTVVGLFWLHPGENRFGSAPANPVRLPAASAVAGAFDVVGSSVTLRMLPGVMATLNGRPFRGSAAMRADLTGHPDVLRFDRFALLLLGRGGRYAIRLKDRESRFRKNFNGLRWFPVNESYRVTTKLVPHPPGFLLRVPNVLGQATDIPSPGTAVFSLHGRQYRLTPVEEDGGLFFIFRDATSGTQTYGGGRFLYTAPAVNGELVLDFNQAENPPCAFTPYATCPLPPRENRLSIPIEAGEKTYGSGHH